ncbi:MAG TPA: DEAD/DEAH box helicase [Candidatus Acidoferrales bacterium]|nr:DEAD/DEAH box helicase [Candidatus Acidoferrales bacterium]
MGYLTEKVFYLANRLTRERGRSYFEHGAVDLLEGDEWSVEAAVQGTRLYSVTIERADDSIEASCTCPYYERETAFCKHIWATVLAAEEEGYLDGSGGGPLDGTEPVSRRARGKIEARQRMKKQPGRAWKDELRGLQNALEICARRPRAGFLSEREFLYLIDLRDSEASGRVVIEVAQREKRMNGAWGALKTKKISIHEVAELADPADRRILTVLLGARQELIYGYPRYYDDSGGPRFALTQPLVEVALPLVCATGRCFLRPALGSSELKALEWDDGPPWELWLRIVREEGERYRLTGVLQRDGGEMELAEPVFMPASGALIRRARIARFRSDGVGPWLQFFRRRQCLSFPKEDAGEFLAEFFRLADRPPLRLPDELKPEVVSVTPRPCLRVKGAEPGWRRKERLAAELSFDYDGERVAHKSPGRGVYQKDRCRLVQRDPQSEGAAVRRLRELGFRLGGADDDYEFSLAADRLPKAVRVLAGEGWRVEAEGKLYRSAGELSIEIASGVDWFDVSGAARFGETSVSLPRLLQAVKRGEQTVPLDDGTFGILPEEWLRRYALLAGFGDLDGSRLRFKKHHTALLDALLADEPEVKTDLTFERLRRELRSFSGVTPVDPTADFSGELRGYQREGLGWLEFLRRFGFGGCLADDMGLGKTVQVLALLEARRYQRAEAFGAKAGRARPSLVVVPRSLVFHWKNEAAKFAPKLKVLDHTGTGRLRPSDHFENYDVVITTYGTLRRDAVQFKDVSFDYCILDEAQAIKNPRTLSAKAARLLRADHRLALSGTPVENHLGELWSLFEFLNPGMLGSAALFGRAGRGADGDGRNLLARALRPFILRRTKEQVARELPPKTEQTIYFDLEAEERRLYDELRDYYRARLLKHIDREGMARVKFQALEALLRLRQAACHPGLLDKSKALEPSAKIETLLAQLDQVLDEGHKALVFSQFTSLLAIVRDRLDRARIPYAYLDGRTRDRRERVEQFQNSPNLKLFLISLKAGGLGLNLHAAEYVYLLDPWWNPAVEAQAIDRAHRIGQTRHVFAYRLIARDTVEEKVLELQKTKRDLADAIITADNSLIHNLTREDLELLLS